MGPPLEGAALKAAVVNRGRIEEGAFLFDAWSWGEKKLKKIEEKSPIEFDSVRINVYFCHDVLISTVIIFLSTTDLLLYYETKLPSSHAVNAVHCRLVHEFLGCRSIR